MARQIITTQVAILGAGPAGLMLSHLLAKAGIESTVIEIRSRQEIPKRPGRHPGARHGEHAGGRRRLRPGAARGRPSRRHRAALQRRKPPHRLQGPRGGVRLALPADRRLHGPGRPPRSRRRGRALQRHGHDHPRHRGQPKVWFTDADGVEYELQADFIAGADGSRSHCRFQIPEANRKWYFHEYPFAWFGILAEAPRSSDELIYANSENGFALISQRTETVQRMYFQCDPNEDVGRLER